MEIRSESKSKHVSKDFKRLRALDYIPEKHLDFMEAVAEAHAMAKDSIAEDKIYPAVAPKKAKEMLAEGFHLVSFERMKPKTGPLRAHLKEICNILMAFGESETSPIEDFSKSEASKKLDLKTFLAKTVSQNGDHVKRFSAKTGIDANTLKFMAVTLARPLFEQAAEQVKDCIDENIWWKNYCPACGSEPSMARIRKADNMRILGCSLCGTEWKFDRVTCPFCDNKDQKTMKFFYFHEGSPHRLYACDKCKRYIKCVDQRKLEVGNEICLPLEDMATLYLDTLARQKGYVSGWSPTATETEASDSE
jgi:formate dehydrogenase maturation protein FdhE